MSPDRFSRYGYHCVHRGICYLRSDEKRYARQRARTILKRELEREDIEKTDPCEDGRCDVCIGLIKDDDDES